MPLEKGWVLRAHRAPKSIRKILHAWSEQKKLLALLMWFPRLVKTLKYTGNIAPKDYVWKWTCISFESLNMLNMSSSICESSSVQNKSSKISLRTSHSLPQLWGFRVIGLQRIPTSHNSSNSLPPPLLCCFPSPTVRK